MVSIDTASEKSVEPVDLWFIAPVVLELVIEAGVCLNRGRADQVPGTFLIVIATFPFLCPSSTYWWASTIWSSV